MILNSKNVIHAPIVELRSATWVVVILTAIFYLLLSLEFEGPTYLQDEVGYLAKAALFAGKPVDAASSYHAGYSILLSPLFWLTSEISKIWVGVVVLNTGLWVANLVMTRRLIPLLSPNIPPLGILAGVAGMASYPAWPILTGYAFSSPLLIAVFLLTLLLLNKLADSEWRSPTALSICAGFAFWIHPTGLAIIAALSATLILAAPKASRFNLLSRFFLITGFMVLTYKGFVHPWINQLMTPHGFESTTHYKSYTEVLTSLLDPKIICRSILRMTGEFSYLIISTLGVFILGAWSLMQSIHRNFKSAEGALALFCLLAMVGVATMAAIQLETFETANQIQHWQYGRYTDTVLPPILAIGFSHIFVKCRKIWILLGLSGTLLFLMVSGWALDQWSHATPDNNIIATPGFWPQYIKTQSTFLNWYILGFAGCLVAFLHPRYTAFPVWIFAASTSIWTQFNWHKDTYQTYSRPTDLPTIIKENYNNGTCIGIDQDNPQGLSMLQSERLNLYSIHLTNMNYKRMHPEQWLQECDGPYLTYHPKALTEQKQAISFIKETDSGLYLIERVQRLQSLPYKLSKNPRALMIGKLDEKDFLLKTIFIRDPHDLSRHTQVGQINNKGLSSTGKMGYLFYGPYASVAPGSYRLEVGVTATSTKGLVLDVVSNHSKKVHWRKNICQAGCSVDAPIIDHFTIGKYTNLLEIRLYVRPTDSVFIHSVKLVAEDGVESVPP